MGIGTQIILIILLTLLNGVLAMSEIALVAARKVRLRQRADAGDRGAPGGAGAGGRPRPLPLDRPGRHHPDRHPGRRVRRRHAGGGAGGLDRSGSRTWPPTAGRSLIGIVVVCITYLSLILGELVPKQLGLNAPEKIAALLARPLKLLSKVSSPAVSCSTAPPGSSCGCWHPPLRRADR